MNVWLWIVTPLVLGSCVYAVLAAGYFFVQDRPGMALAFCGYIMANAGVIWDALAYVVVDK